MATRGEKLLGLAILLVVVTLPLWARWYAETFGYRQEVAGYRVEFKSLSGVNEFRDGKVYVRASCGQRWGCYNKFALLFKDGLPRHLTVRIQLKVGKKVRENTVIKYTEPKVKVDVYANVPQVLSPVCSFWATSGEYVVELFIGESGVERCLVNGEELEMTGRTGLRIDAPALAVKLYGDFYFEAVVSFEP